MALRTARSSEGGRRSGVAPSVLGRRLIRAVAPFAGALVLVAGIATVAGGLYATSLDERCAACHRPQAERLADSAHRNVSCYGCHLDGGAWGFLEHKHEELFRMYPRASKETTLTGPGRRVARATCIGCHGSPPPDVLVSKGLKIRHDTCAAPPEGCDTCHNTVAHGDAVRWPREPVMDACVACHNRNGAPTACTTCHAGKLQAERLLSGPWQVTHGPQWQRTHGMGDLATCRTCHEPTKCIGCHRTEIPHPTGFIRVHGDEALKKDARCTRCHRTKGWCTSCHGVEMPHPGGFLKRHSGVATSPSDKRCARCHAREDCINCHVAHTHPGRTEGTLGRAFELDQRSGVTTEASR